MAGTLASELGRAGHEVLLLLPLYREVRAGRLKLSDPRPLEVPLGRERVRAALRLHQARGFAACFLEHDPSYDRPALYGPGGGEYPDNDRRYALFCRAALEAAKALDFRPEVVHVHDWHAGLIPALLKTLYRGDPFFSQTASLMTIHNLAYQGNFPRGSLALTGLPDSEFTHEGVEFHGRVSYLKAGLVHADLLSTVSPSYAREAQAPGRGFGLEGLLRARSADFHGVLNGLDTGYWDPSSDPHLPRSYSARDLEAGKAAAKEAVRAECGLKGPADRPLVAVVSRLDGQKGLDLAIEALEPRLQRCSAAILGTGDPALRDALAAFAARRPGSVSFREAFDEPFAHRLYAAADLLLMPSRFEPCGLGQMIAMRYGTLPVASRTGGLADTVFETAARGRRANGFLAAPGDAEDLGRALDRALDARPAWKSRAKAAMAQDFSWKRSAKAYAKLFALARRSLPGVEA